MRVNVDKVLERGQKISELEDKSGTRFLDTTCHKYVNFFPRWPLI